MSLSFDTSFGEKEYRKSIERLKAEFKSERDKLMVEAKKRQVIELKLDEKDLQNKGKFRHEKFDDVAIVLRNRLNAFLHGPAGSGKSFITEQVAEIMKIPYYSISVSYQTSVSTLMGYMDANGKYVKSLLREAFEKGGVFCIDEIDAGNQNVIMCLNAVTNNEMVAFPDAMVKKHKDFICVATANTSGNGNDLQYVGRERIDASTLSRFVKIYIPYDDTMEANMIAESEYRDQILDEIHKLRDKVTVDSNNLFTPRQTVAFAKLCADIGFENARRIICEQ